MSFVKRRKRFGERSANREGRRPSGKRLLGLQSLEVRSLLSMTPSGIDLAPAEGLAFNGAVATFTATDAGPFNATIDWGDGSTSVGTVSSNSGVYTVAASHNYADEGTDTVSVAIIDAADATTAAVTSTATVGDSDALTPSPGQYAVTGMEGLSVNANVALFADSGYPANAAADFTSTIDWGDGTTSAGTVSGPATTALDMFSQPGDWVGGGATYHFTPATGSFSASNSANDSQISFSYREPGFNQWWYVEFAAPNGGTLVPGVYDNAARAAFHPPNQPGLEVSGDGRGSNTLTGSFTITQAVYDAGGHVLSFDATFVQHSEGAAPALTGEIKYNASGGSYTVSGSHTYADDGSYKITAILADDAPGTASATATATAEIASALALSPSASTLNVTEGATATAVLALITNPVGAEPASDYLATINWGDGTTSAGTITGAAGAYTVAGSHAYADEGKYNVSVTAREASAPTAPLPTVTLIAQVADGDLLVGAAAPISAMEGAIFTGAALATFADAGYPDNNPDGFTAVIDWGDGTTAVGAVSTAGDGTFTVSSNHIYTDEGTYPVKITLADDAPGAASATATATAAVAEGDALAAGPSVTASATEGTAFNGIVATFVDGNANNSPADFSSTIDWGDGTTSAGTVSDTPNTSLDMASQPGDYIGGGATYDFTPATGTIGVSSHFENDSQITFAYREPNLGHWWYVAFAAPNGTTLVPGVYDNAGRAAFRPPNQPGLDVYGDGRGSNTLTGGFTITEAVYDASGNVLRFDATFVQHSEGAGPALTGEIKFNALTGTFTVSGSHAYASDGVYAIAASLAEDSPGTASATASATANVASALTLSPPNSSFAATEKATASGVVALISDPMSADPASDFLATIDWGDGATTAGTVTGAAGSYTVAGSHTYSDEGDFTVTVSALEAIAPPAPAATATFGVHVADGDSLVGTMAAIAATEGATFIGAALATFSGAGYPNNDPADFAAVIDWGDGSSTAGNVSTTGDGSFTVSGNHLYFDEGSFPVQVTLSDDAPGAATATATTTATVADADVLGAGPEITANAKEGTAFSGIVATFGDSGYSNSPPTNFTATIDWGDGTTASGSVTSQASGEFTVSGRHTYADEGTFGVTISLAENAPGTAAAAATATVVVSDADQTINYPDFANTAGLTINGHAAQAGNALRLTDGGIYEAGAAFFNTPIDLAHSFQTQFTFEQHDGSNPPADGLAFVIQNSTSGAQALGRDGGDVGYGGVAPSVAVKFDLFQFSYPGSNQPYVGVLSGGSSNFISAKYPGFPLYGTNPIYAWIDYDAGAKQLSIYVNTSNQKPADALITQSLDLSATVGQTGWVGFSGGSGALTAVQDIQSWQLSSGTDGAMNVAGLTGLYAGSNSFAGAIATFTTPYTANVADDFTANIDWGDGTSSAGTISGSAGAFTVSGSHLYAAAGEMTVVVDVRDKAPGTAAGSATATIDVGDTPNRKYVTAVYENVLGRAPDAKGLDYWANQLDHGAAIIQVAESIAHSAEYYANFVIKPAFLKLLGRSVDDAGLTYWTQQMQGGLTDQQLEAGLLASDEFYAKAENFDPAADADDTTIADTDQNVDWIDAIYQLLLGRTPDSDGEKYWSGQLSAGVSREEAAMRIANSAENDSQLIKADYLQYLGRAADQDGLDYWLGQLSAGTTNEDIIAGFTGSDEYYKEHTA